MSKSKIKSKKLGLRLIQRQWGWGEGRFCICQISDPAPDYDYDYDYETRATVRPAELDLPPRTSNTHSIRMDSLGHPDSLYLRAAQGWLELGNATEALGRVGPDQPRRRQHPDALELRWQLAVKRQGWEEALLVAEELCRLAPKSAFGWIHRSYCLHELKRTQEAWDVLLPVADVFPDEWLIAYNLACYACQLGRLPEARTWLRRAMETGDPLEINGLAAHDLDLKPLFAKPAA